MRRSARWTFVATVAAPFVTLGMGTAAAAASIPHPSAPDVVVLRVTTVAPAGERGGPTVTIRGDGAAVIQPTLGGPGHASPEPLVFRIDEAGVQRVLQEARAAGLFRRVDYGHPIVTDHRTTAFELDAGGRHRTVSVESLASSDRGLASTPRAARRALRSFAHEVTTPTFYDGTRAAR